MPDPAHHFNRLVHEAFSLFFGERLPADLGSEAFKTTFCRLKVEGLLGVDHVEEVVARALAKSLEYVHKHGGSSVRQPRAWFHEICRNETTQYLIEMVAHDSGLIHSLMES